MRRRLLTLLLAALAAITMAMPLWAALGSERRFNDGLRTLQVHRTNLATRPVAEAATLVVTGIMLIGLASVVRRTS